MSDEPIIIQTIKDASEFTFGRISEAWLAADKKYDRTRRELDEQIARLEVQRANLKYPHYMDRIVAKIGKAMLSRLPAGTTMEVSGPFGLCCQSYLSFHNQAEISKKNSDGCIGMLLFVDDSEHGCRWRDTSKTTGKYPPNTLGYMNGMNHQDIEIPHDADVGWFIERMSRH